MRRILFSVFICHLLAVSSFAQGPDVVIPVPAHIEINPGTYIYDSEPAVRIIMLKSVEGGDEAYNMKVSRKGIVIKASTEKGLFYARQTLRQMTGNGSIKEIQCCEITD